MNYYVRTFWACPFCESADLDVTLVVRCKNCGAVANTDSWNARSAKDFENVLALRNAPTLTTYSSRGKAEDQRETNEG